MQRSYSLISATSSSKPRTQYDVFLSFRGEDTRYSFTSHLYEALCQKGIYTFLDDDKLERGKSISPELLKAIENSGSSIIILSENYASSTWCLDELVKILQCREAYKQIVMPIFYHVDPSHVRKQVGSFGEAFERHEQAFSHNLEKVQTWRDALKEVSNLAGWHLHDRNEAKFIKDLIVEVTSKLGVARLNILEDLFGLESRLEKLNFCVCNSSLDDALDVRFIGICGMGGIGKTTIARAYYDWMSSEFECSSFLENVREVCEKENNGLVYLQNLLLSDILNQESTKIRDTHRGKNIIRSRLCHKKVLIVLDDVDKLDQLKVLAEKDNWFGSGSRILVTTRDESLLISTYNACEIYRAEELNDNEGLQLFAWKAFKSSHPSKDYTEVSKQVIAYAKGLPLALEVLGSFLRGKTVNEWENALDRLKKNPEKKIVKVLQITFDGLEETEKNIFLDIACFFKGCDKDYIMQIMDSCGFYPRIGIRNLIDKSLIYSGPNNKLWMHDLLQEMGREIVREKSRNEPGRWSRLWDYRDVRHVLENNTATEEVEAIECHLPRCWEAISKMKKLRLLIGSGLQGGLTYLSNELRILNWFLFPFTSLPSSFQPDGLVELKLSSSNITQLWNNPIKPLYNLKIIDLSGSTKIREFKDFGMAPNLEKLILERCSKLVEVHPSITLLRRLTLLNLNHCSSLKSLPTSINGLNSLKVLKLSHCRKVSSLPEDLGHLHSLEELHLGSCFPRDVLRDVLLYHRQDSFDVPIYVKSQCEDTMNIIVGKGLISGCHYSLKKLNLSNLSLRDGAIPEDFGCLASLEELDLSCNRFSYLPASMNQLSKLRNLDLINCNILKSLGPELPSSLEMVWVDGCTSLRTFLDPSDDHCHLTCSASCLNCFELATRQGFKKTALASLKRYLQNPPNPSKRFDIVLPGDKIPVWFTHRSFVPSISLELDPNWCNSEWRGFALSVFKGTDSRGECKVKIDGQDWGFGFVECPGFFRSRTNHLWVFYLPRDIYFHAKWQKNCSTRLEFTFDNGWGNKSNRDNKYRCGVRLVYEQDIQDLNLQYDDDANFPRYEQGIQDLNLQYDHDANFPRYEQGIQDLDLQYDANFTWDRRDLNLQYDDDANFPRYEQDIQDLDLQYDANFTWDSFTWDSVMDDANFTWDSDE